MGKHSDPLLELVEPPIVGESFHVTWANNGIMGICGKVLPNNSVILVTPKTKKPFKYPIPFNQLRHTRAQEMRIKQGKRPYWRNWKGNEKKLKKIINIAETYYKNNGIY